MMTIYFVWVQRINFSRTLSVFTTTLFFYNSKTSLENIVFQKNYLKYKDINHFLITDVTAFKETIVLRAFLDKISSKLKKFKTNIEDMLHYKNVKIWTYTPFTPTLKPIFIVFRSCLDKEEIPGSYFEGILSFVLEI